MENEVVKNEVKTETAPEAETLTLEQLAQFKANIEKEVSKKAYEQGKTAEREMLLKDLKKSISEKFGVETEGIKDFETLFEKAIATKETKVKETKNSEVETLLKEKELLQKTVAEIQTDFEKKLQEKEKEFKTLNTNLNVSQVATAIPFAVPKHIESLGDAEIQKFIATEQTKFVRLFLSEYNIDFAENGQTLVLKNGEILKDKLQNPLSINEVALTFAKDFNFLLKSENAQTTVNRETNSSKKYANDFTGIKNTADFNEFLKQKNINPGSNEALTYYAEWKNQKT